MKCIFIGPRSVGKSTTGLALADKLDIDYFDFDEYVESKLDGIDEYVKNHNVESYRAQEEKLLKLFLLELPESFIVSVGGGTVASQFKEITQRNIQVLKQSGKLVYLSPSENKDEATEILFEREQKRNGDKDFFETMKLFELRKLVYEEIFDIKIDVGHKSPSKIADETLLKLSTE